MNQRCQDVEFPFNSIIPPAIPDGEQYEAVFVRAEQVFQWGQEKVLMHFKMITPGEWHNQEFFMTCTVPAKRRWGPSSKFWQAYVLANGSRPNRRDRMNTRVFRNKVFRVRLRKVTKNAKQTKRSPAQQYSVIDELLEVVTGR